MRKIYCMYVYNVQIVRSSNKKVCIHAFKMITILKPTSTRRCTTVMVPNKRKPPDKPEGTLGYFLSEVYQASTH